MRRSALLALAMAAAACGDETRGEPAPGSDAPPYDRVWQISTHNSYWVNRGTSGDLFASGVEERLLDQLLADHARGVEIDIHRDPGAPGRFAVHHTTPGNHLCASLDGCLAALRAFHRAIPRHEAVHVTLELKELMASNFDADHTIEDLDRVLRDELGALLYTPADFLRRCDDPLPRPTETLASCARSIGWPRVDELRGRVLVSVLGNWNGLPGAQATKDWADYALHGDIRARAAFPMASSWQLDWTMLAGQIVNLVTQDEIDRAFEQSIFLQVEDLADPQITPFLGRHGVIRMDGAFSADDQSARAALGMQLLQSDSPWVQLDDRGPSEPLRALEGDARLREPGSRLRLREAKEGERAFAAMELAATGTSALEAAVSSGADAGVGCLRAASALGVEVDSVTVCRTKIAAQRGEGAAPSPDAERAIVRVTTCHAGACAEEAFPSDDPLAAGPGELLRLEVTNGAGGVSCARALSASVANRDLTPAWQPLGDARCFAAPLAFQGLAAPGPSWFFGVGGEIDGELVFLAGDDFTSVVAEPIDGAGEARPDASLLEDASSQ